MLFRSVSLDPEAAAALATHKGRLHLTGLVAPSPEVVAALSKHPRVLLPRISVQQEQRDESAHEKQ